MLVFHSRTPGEAGLGVNIGLDEFMFGQSGVGGVSLDWWWSILEFCSLCVTASACPLSAAIVEHRASPPGEEQRTGFASKVSGERGGVHPVMELPNMGK